MLCECAAFLWAEKRFCRSSVSRENNSSKNSSLTEASTKCLAGAQPGIIQKTYLDPKEEGLSDDFSTHKGKLSVWNWQVKVSFYFSHWLHALPPFFLTCLLPLSFPFLLLSSSFSSPPPPLPLFCKTSCWTSSFISNCPLQTLNYITGALICSAWGKLSFP